MTIQKRARDFAIHAHGEQMYGDQPYSFHLDAVVANLADHGESAQVVGYLHDVVEDTSVTTEQVEAAFGSFVARCVCLLSDQPGETRKERKAKTYAKLALVHGEECLALTVKVADRLANVRAAVLDKNPRLLNIYQSEHATFRSAAYRPGQCDALWDELDRILNEQRLLRE